MGSKAAGPDVRGEPGIPVEFSKPVIAAAGPVWAFAGPRNSEPVVRLRTPVFLADGLLSSVTRHSQEALNLDMVALDSVNSNSQAIRPLQMPIQVRFVQYAIAFGLALLIAFTGREVFLGGASLWKFVFPGYCLAALVGLMRRVVWGRFMVSSLSVFLAFIISAGLLPDIDDAYGGSGLERIFGFMPPLWLSWLIIVFAVSLMLFPAVVIGWRKDWFRRALW